MPTRVRAPQIPACLLVLMGAATAQTIVSSFDGDSGPGLAVCESGVTHCDRPDLNVGASGKQAVQVTWQNFRVYDYSGHLLRSTPMATLIRNAGLNPIPPKENGPFEPQIVYNEFINRWIISVTGLNETLLVSASSDALGSWGGVSLSCLQGGPCLDFDPAAHLGYDKNGMYQCGGHAGEENSNTVPRYAYDCFAIPQAEVPGIAQGKAPVHLNRTHRLPLDIMPAIDHNRSKPASAPALFVAKTCDRSVPGGCQNSSNFAFRWIVDTFTWNGLAGTYNSGGEQMIRTSVGSREDKWLYNKPGFGATASIPQAGSDMHIRAAESHRLANLVQFGSHLYGVMGSGPCTSSCGSQGTDTTNVMFWVDLDCSKPSACVVSHTAKISGPDFNPEFPTVGVDSEGNIGIVASSSTATTDLSLLLWTHRKSDASGVFQGPKTIVSGTQPYTCLNKNSMNSIGGPAGILTALDPLDGTKLWTTEQWSNDAARCVWNTRIVAYQVAGKSNKR